MWYLLRELQQGIQIVQIRSLEHQIWVTKQNWGVPICGPRSDVLIVRNSNMTCLWLRTHQLIIWCPWIMISLLHTGQGFSLLTYSVTMFGLFSVDHSPGSLPFILIILRDVFTCLMWKTWGSWSRCQNRRRGEAKLKQSHKYHIFKKKLQCKKALDQQVSPLATITIPCCPSAFVRCVSPFTTPLDHLMLSLCFISH